MFTVVTISDTHGFHNELTVPEGDCVIHAGDFSIYGELKETVLFLDWFKSLPYEYKILICGNHEVIMSKNPSLFKSMIPDNVIYLEDSEVIIEGYKIYGSPYSPKFGNWAYSYNRGYEARVIWNKIPEDTDILVTHGMPHRILDYSPYIVSGRTDQNVGCVDLRLRIEEINPLLFIGGHLHYNGCETLKLGKTRYVNAAQCDEDYKVRNHPIIIRFEGKEIVSYDTAN